MSCDIRKYGQLTLTAFVGPFSERECIQFTIGGKFEQMGPAALLDMVKTIMDRILFAKGYTATGDERDDIEYKDPLVRGMEEPKCTCFNGYTSSVCPVHSEPAKPSYDPDSRITHDEPAKPKRYRCKGCGSTELSGHPWRGTLNGEIEHRTGEGTFEHWCGPVEEET